MSNCISFGLQLTAHGNLGLGSSKPESMSLAALSRHLSVLRSSLSVFKMNKLLLHTFLSTSAKL